MRDRESYATCRVEPGGLRIWFSPYRRLREANQATMDYMSEQPGQRFCVVRVRWEGTAACEVMIVDRLTGRSVGTWVKPLPPLTPGEEAS